MRIVFCSTTFVPRVGGIENLTEMTAHALGTIGDDVSVLTQEAGPPMPDRAYRLIRQPGPLAIMRACRGADAVIMPNIGLKLMPGVLAARAPFFVWHQHEYRDMAKTLASQPFPIRLKGLLIERYVRANLGCSDYITALMPASRPRATLANPYDPSLFFTDSSIMRDRDIVALGRLVPEKGFSVAIEALALAGAPLATARLSIVGDGPDRAALEGLARTRGVADRVSFLGVRKGAELRATLNAHKVLVVPSIWNEPFGIVALEGLAAGCGLAVSRMGGLPEAVGAFGRHFDPQDIPAAAAAIGAVLADPGALDTPERARHLERHTARAVATKLKALIESFA